ncbi:MAG: hypothetical protein KF865_11635 [Bdellovibrionaceae bacterium]|nr:hypothetical protein [Pseudobdellovibrionaceae bacterium]
MSKFYSDVERPLTRVFLFVLMAFWSLQSWAWPPTYGAEFELTRVGLGVHDFSLGQATQSFERQEQLRFVQKMRERCEALGCRITEVRGKWDQDFRVEFSDGWWFKVSYDPGCVEITFKPSPLETLREKARLINDAIFSTANQIGLEVKPNETSHFNMGIRSAFDDSAKDFVRFFADYANHPDLALGSLGHDVYNAPPLSVLNRKQRGALQRIIDAVNAGEMTTITEAARAIQNQVYTESYYKPWGGIHHYQAVGLKYVNKTNLQVSDAPLELRAVWIQESAEKFNLVSELIEGRVRYLKTLTTPIIYTAPAHTEFSNSELHSRFLIYVEEAGLSLKKFQDLLPTVVRQAELSNFVRRDLPPRSRLQGASQYIDLIPASEWVRNQMIELISHPDTRGSSAARGLEDKIRAAAAKQQVKETHPRLIAEAYQQTLTAIQERITRPAPLFAPEVPSRFSNGVQCQAVF